MTKETDALKILKKRHGDVPEPIRKELAADDLADACESVGIPSYTLGHLGNCPLASWPTGGYGCACGAGRPKILRPPAELLAELEGWLGSDKQRALVWADAAVQILDIWDYDHTRIVVWRILTMTEAQRTQAAIAAAGKVRKET